MYAYDGDAMAQASTLDPYRVAATMTWTVTDEDDAHADGTAYVGTVDHTLDGPRGAQRFARMWAYYSAHGIMPDPLADALNIRIGTRGQTGIGSPAGQRQMIAILRWLLACAGHGEDVLQAAILAALETRYRDGVDGLEYDTRWGHVTVGEIMAHTPAVIETIEWSRPLQEGQRIPLEWVE